jgi:hypothetical protein
LVSEPRSVDEYPGIRVLRLWTPDAMPSRPSYLEPEKVFLASVKRSGGLAVTSCLGYPKSRDVPIPDKDELWGADEDKIVAVSLRDIVFVRNEDPYLVGAHIGRAQGQGFDPYAPPEDPHSVDFALATLLSVLPEPYR